MNKKIFAGLIILMGISILGIIAVQLVWMNNAIRVKNEMFRRSVNEALIRTVNRLEDLHNLGVVNEMVFEPDSVNWTLDSVRAYDFEFNNSEEFEWIGPDSMQYLHRQIMPSSGKPVKIIREFAPGNSEAIIEVKVESDSNNEHVQTFSYNINSNKKVADHIIVTGNASSKNLVFVKSDTLITNADSLYTISTIRIDSLLTNLDTFQVLRPDLTKRIQLKAGNLKRMASKVVTEVSNWDVNQLDEKLIADVLKKELSQSQIALDFELGIIRDSIAEFPITIVDSVEVVNSEYRAQLYPNDIFQKNIELAVFFPEKDSFIYRSLNWLLLASLFFSLFILVTFALSVFYILRQKKISEMKSDFINNMTHEFKTPIATISVATDSIVNEKVVGNPEQIRYFAGMIKKENTRMNRQVEDILTIARLDRKDFEFTWETIDVHELISDAVQGIILQVEKRGGKIQLNLKAANPMVTTDKNHCTNVVYNLLDNANKYSSETPEITISSRNIKKGILITVEDKGIGMSKATQGKIFERFYRQTSGNIHNVKGFGLGLSYVKAVIEANLGNISVISETGRGSKFDVFLPFVRE